MDSSQNDILYMLYASPRSVFTIGGIGLMAGRIRGDVLAKRLNYYVRTGKMLNPRRGIYAKPGYTTEELACVLYTPCYLSLETVLQRAGVVFQYDESITLISYLSRAVEVDGRQICYRRMKGEILADTRGIVRGNNINTATVERAFLDTLYLNANYHFDNLRPLDRRLVMQLLPIYNNRTMEARVRRIFDKSQTTNGYKQA